MESRVKISHYSKKGHGLGTFQKTPQMPPAFAEVVGTVIGDVALAQVGKKRKKVYFATLKDIIVPSENRVAPRCEHVGMCGGCTWQQKAYLAQLREKEKQIETLFHQKPLSIIPAKKPWHYRSKMEYTFSQNKGGEKFLGLIMARSKGRAFNLKECYLTPPWFMDVLKAVYQWWEKSSLKAYHPHSDEGTLRTLTLRDGKRTGDKMAFITISGRSDFMINKTEIEGFKEAVLSALPGEDPSLFLRIQRAARKIPTTLYEMHLGGPDVMKEALHIGKRELMFNISPGSFFQPNPIQAEKLYHAALKLANPKPDEVLFDLYCGGGALAIVFAPYVRKVVGIELSPYAICDAELNIQENKLSNIHLLRGDVGKVLAEQRRLADIAVIDPPRAGLSQGAIRHLTELAPKKIVYISCNPVSQSQNISKLILEGYILRALQPVDQFPHTYHLENIAVLEKS